MTDFIKKNEIKNNWLLIDAENVVVGRLAAYFSKALRGKNKRSRPFPVLPSPVFSGFLMLKNPYYCFLPPNTRATSNLGQVRIVALAAACRSILKGRK